MKVLIIKGVAFATLSIATLDVVSQGYMAVRNTVIDQVTATVRAAVLGTAEDMGFDLKPTITDKNVKELVTRLAKGTCLSDQMAMALVSQESSYDPNAISEAGAIGLAQVMPNNAKACGLPHAGYLKDPETNIKCGFKIMCRDIASNNGDIHKGIQEYFGGKTCVNNDSCPKTRKYVREYLQKLALR